MNDFIYLNNAATSWPTPPCVAEAVSKAIIDKPGSAQRAGVDDFDVFGRVRKKMARILGVSAIDNIALGSNATWGLNLGIFGYPFEKGDVVVTTKSEHNSVLRPLFSLAQQGLIEVVYVDTDLSGRIVPEKWNFALERHKPKLVVFNHASNVTGAVNNAKSLCSAAKDAGAVVLTDVSQSCGWVEIMADDWGADMVAFTGHKYLLGPQGTGGLYVRPGLMLRPHMVGGTGAYSDLETMPEEMPARLEAGTGSEPALHGLLAALEWAEGNPPDHSALDETFSSLRDGLSGAGCNLILPEGECIPTISFDLPGYTPAELGYILCESYDIICRTGLHCAPKLFECIERQEGTVRFSMSRFTTMDEVDAAVCAMKDIADAV